MKKIAFFGACEKSDLLLVLGKLLAAADQKVLVVDATTTQGMYASLPVSCQQPHTLLTEVEGLDVACGFFTFEQLEHYVKRADGHLLSYDVMLIDTDHTEFVKGSELPLLHQRVLVTSFEKLCLLRNVRLLDQYFQTVKIGQPLDFHKVIYPFMEFGIREAYLDGYYSDYPIRWQDHVYRFPLDVGDVAVKLENQHHGRIDARRLSRAYAKTLLSLAGTLTGLDARTLTMSWKRVKRRGQHGI
ncbi:hypothetical protein B5M42_020945 [Paenibacillus athensensis]|uniref:Uncharacterized protein n=1 Tax=Paenibacillus athensensis TaxID=1967502 RepID=A0A4Y8PYK4_9BACL|nr:hypothetical protein [Paenibacillus athensensis]MCD1261272.1 hypothetical protein [Paenibacillus athensensis]